MGGESGELCNSMRHGAIISRQRVSYLLGVAAAAVAAAADVRGGERHFWNTSGLNVPLFMFGEVFTHGIYAPSVRGRPV